MRRNGIRLPDLSDLTNDRAEIVRIEGRLDETTYVWDSRVESLDEIRRGFNQSQRIAIVGRRPSDIIYSSGLTQTRLFVALSADCMDPPLYFVLADSWEEAYETACDDMPGIRIAAESLKDYEIKQEDGTVDHHCNWTSDGKPIDTESLQVHELRLTRIELA